MVNWLPLPPDPPTKTDASYSTCLARILVKHGGGHTNVCAFGRKRGGVAPIAGHHVIVWQYDRVKDLIC